MRHGPAAWMGLFVSAGIGQWLLALQEIPLALPLGLAFFALSFYFLSRNLPAPSPGTSGLPGESGVPGRLEAAAFLGLILLAAFFRLWGEAPLPNGVFADRAEVALGALRILHEGWRPFLSALHLHVPEVPIYYLAALWFKLFGADPVSFARFDAALSLAGLVLAYGFLRLAAGPRAALFTLFLLAVMRWNFVFGRQVYFHSQTVLFTGAALLPLLLALRRGSAPLALLAGFAAGAALYAYQALKILPIFLAGFALFEFLRDRQGFRGKAGIWALLAASFLLTAAPYLLDSFSHGTLGRRESEVAVTQLIQREGSLKPLFSNLAAACGMFNRRGDDNSQSNFENRRMLDDLTGILFLLGLFQALRGWRHPARFLGLWGLAAFSLPAILSINGAHAGRMLGTTPFVALLGGLLLGDLWEKWGKGQGRRSMVLGLLALAAGTVFLNYRDYFRGQALDPDYRNDFSWEESQAGRLAASAGEADEFFLASRFHGHPTVRYLARVRASNLHPLDLSRMPRLQDYPRAGDFHFLMDERKAGVLEYLQSSYPGGRVEAFTNPIQATPLYAYHVSREALAKGGPDQPRRGPRRGLKGIYRREGEEVPFLERWDPVVNFTFQDLPGMPAPLRVDWRGKLLVPGNGRYRLLVLTYENEGLNRAQVAVDGRQSPFTACPELELDLAAGWHDLVLEYRKPEGSLATVNLLWKRPGRDRYEFVPNSAFGPMKKQRR